MRLPFKTWEGENKSYNISSSTILKQPQKLGDLKGLNLEL